VVTQVTEGNYLSEVMLRTSEIMQHKLAEIREAFNHPGNKGDGAEETLRSFLKDYLPQGLGIGTGEIIDHEGRHSKQCDVVVFNPLRAPTFSKSEDHFIFPAESVVAVIEVKTKLAATDIPDIVEAMKSVKQLDRSGLVSPWKHAKGLTLKHNWYGKQYDFPPIMYFVFSFESQSLQKIWEQLTLEQIGLPIDKRIDSVYCLDKGSLLWFESDKRNASALPTSSLYWSLVPTKHSLLMFYILTFEFMAQSVDLIRFDPTRYSPNQIETGQIMCHSFHGCSTPEEVWDVFLGNISLTELLIRNINQQSSQ